MRLLRFTLKSLEGNRRLAKWEKRQNRGNSEKVQVAHMLIVKDLRYIKMARTCVASFLYYNPDFRVIIHSDENIYDVILKEFKRSKIISQIQIKLDQDSETEWQKLKMNLMLSMNGSRDILMDADLRWNGVLTQENFPTFLTCEFEMAEKSPARQIANVVKREEESPKMYNTSYFSFGGCNISESDINDLSFLYENYENILNQSDIGDADINLFGRLSEQFAMSVSAPRWGYSVRTLKSTDSPRDGSFVESTYFGVTGDIF